MKSIFQNRLGRLDFYGTLRPFKRFTVFHEQRPSFRLIPALCFQKLSVARMNGFLSSADTMREVMDGEQFCGWARNAPRPGYGAGAEPGGYEPLCHAFPGGAKGGHCAHAQHRFQGGNAGIRAIAASVTLPTPWGGRVAVPFYSI